MKRVTEEELSHLLSIMSDEEHSTTCSTATRAFLRNDDKKSVVLSLSLVIELLNEISASRKSARRLAEMFNNGALSELVEYR